LILLASPVAIERMPTDIFPNIDIPVVAVDWSYTGLSPVAFEGRIVSLYERSLSTTVYDIEHIDSQTINGKSIVKVFFQQGVNVNTAIAEVTAVSQSVLSQMPKSITPPLIISYNASTVPILQLSLSSATLSEQELGDLGMNTIRSQLATVAGAAVPWPCGGKSPRIMVDLNPALMQANGVSPQNVLSALTAQSLILPAGTAKLDAYEYNVDMNGSSQTVSEIGDLPLKTANGATLYMHDIGSWRSTLIIAISIPLSILSSLLTLAALHETINTMALGGLVLAVGILVDDATVVIENIERYREQGMSLHKAILQGASEISIPVLDSTLCICIVFLPMFFLSGVPRYLFVPLAESVVFAMLASYILSLTLVPALAQYILPQHTAEENGGIKKHRRNPFTAFQKRFAQGFQLLRNGYSRRLRQPCGRRESFFRASCFSSWPCFC
jgi:multidrug efflux pump subunit AcrB